MIYWRSSGSIVYYFFMFSINADNFELIGFLRPIDSLESAVPARMLD